MERMKLTIDGNIAVLAFNHQEVLNALSAELLAPLPGFRSSYEADWGRLHMPREGSFWLRDRAEGPRRSGVTCSIVVRMSSSARTMSSAEVATDPTAMAFTRMRGERSRAARRV